MNDVTPPQDNDLTPPQGDTPATETESRTVPYERFKKVYDELSGMKAQMQAYQDRQKEAEEAQLAEENKFKELAEQRAATIQQLQGDLSRSQIAQANNIPPELATMLTGDEEQMRAQAATLAEMLKPTTAPLTMPNSPTTSPPAEITDSQMNDPKWIRKNKGTILGQS